MGHGPRKSIQLAHPGRKDTSGSLIWDVDNTFLCSFIWSGKLVLGKDEVFPAVAQEGFCLWTGWKLCVLRSFKSVHKPTLVALPQNLPRGVLVSGTQRTFIWPTLTGLKSNLVFTAIYDEDNDNLLSFFPIAN